MSTLTEPTRSVAASVAGADLIAPPAWAPDQHPLARGILEHSKQMLALADGAAAALAILVAPALFAQNGPAPAVLAALGGGLAFIAAGAMVRLYQARYVDLPGEEIRRVAWAALLVGASIVVGAWALARPVERSWLGVVLAAIATAVSVERQGIRVLFDIGRRRRLLLRRVAIVGTNHEAWAVRQVLADDPATGYEVVAVIRPPQSEPPADRQKETERGLHTIREAQASGVLIPAGAVDPDNANRLIRRLTDEGLHVEITSALRDVNVRRLRMRPVGPLSVTYVEAVARGGWRTAAKRGFDVRRIFREVVQTLSNRSFLSLFLGALFFAMGIGVTAALNIYMMTYFWGLEPIQISIVVALQFISALIAPAISPAVMRRFDKKSSAIGLATFALIFGSGPVLLRLAGWFPSNGSTWLLPILGIHNLILVAAFIMVSIAFTSMTADVAEENEIRTGRREEGLFFAARNHPKGRLFVLSSACSSYPPYPPRAARSLPPPARRGSPRMCDLVKGSALG